MRPIQFISITALVAAAFLTGCRADQQAGQDSNGRADHGMSVPRAAELTLPSGSSLDVTLNTAITSETASIGDAWSGTVRNAMSLDGHNLIPAGSPVSGTVSGCTAARKGDRAMLGLALGSITVNDHNYPVRGSMESVIAGSTRARNLGAIGAATVAGAVAGHAIGGSGKGTVLGGLIGAGAAAGVVSQTKGWQVVLKSGTPLTFTTQQSLAVRI